MRRIRDLATLERWIAAAREAGHRRHRHRDHRRSTRCRPSSSASRSRSRRAAPPTSRSATAPATATCSAAGWSRARSRSREALGRAEAAARGPGRSSRSARTSSTTWLVLPATASTSRPIDDTMLMSYALDAGTGSHGMDALSERWLGHTPIAVQGRRRHRQGRRSTFDQRRRSTRRPHYAAEDADVTLRLWHVLKPRLAAEGADARLRAAGAAAGAGAGAHGSARHHGRPADPVAALGRFRPARRRARGRDLRARRRDASTSARPSSSATSCSARWACPAARKTKTGAWSTGAACWRTWPPQGHELPRKHRRLAPAHQAEIDLHRRAARLHPSARPARPHLLRAGRRRRPGGSPRPSRTCRTSRSAPRRAARSAPPSSPTPGNKLISADYSQIELRVLAHIADIPQLKAGLRGRPRHPRHDGVRNVRRAGRGHADRSAPPRQGDQFRHHLRHLRLRPRQPARASRASEAGDYIKTYFERFPGIRDYMDATKAFAREQRLCRDDLRPARPLSRDPLVQPVRARLRRARRDQRADPGLGRRHHPPRHDPHGRRAGRGRARRPHAAAGP